MPGFGFNGKHECVQADYLEYALINYSSAWEDSESWPFMNSSSVMCNFVKGYYAINFRGCVSILSPEPREEFLLVKDECALETGCGHCVEYNLNTNVVYKKCYACQGGRDLLLDGTCA